MKHFEIQKNIYSNLLQSYILKLLCLNGILKSTKNNNITHEKGESDGIFSAYLYSAPFVSITFVNLHEH